MGTATFVKQVSGTGDGRVYRLDPPMEVEGDETTEFVWVSAAVAFGFGPETYIFASTEDGAVTNWMELDGSFRGSLDHEEALRNAGYEVSA